MTAATAKHEEPKMALRNSRWTQVYADGVNSAGTGHAYYVRLVPLETPRFPHGLSVGGQTFDDKATADKFADDVDAYMEAVFASRLDKIAQDYDSPAWDANERLNAKLARLCDHMEAQGYTRERLAEICEQD
jgi:hypothetical protein